MENATKGLLIAASVLIVIVLISIGIRILGSASGVTNQIDSVSISLAASTFNSQFTPYFSNSTSGTQARTLIQKIIANNATSSHKILVYCPDESSDYLYSGISGKSDTLSPLLAKISTVDHFKINVYDGCSTYSHGYDNGYIACILIDKI